MEDFKKLYFDTFGKVADIIEEYQNNPIYHEIVEKLIHLQLETEEMYMDMESDEDKAVDDMF